VNSKICYYPSAPLPPIAGRKPPESAEGEVELPLKSVLDPVVRNAFAWRIPVPGDALLETTGRRTGRRRRTPVCDGLVADTFWLVARHGIARSNLARAASVHASAAMATQPLTIRIDLDAC